MARSTAEFYQRITQEALQHQNEFEIRFVLNSVPSGVNDALDDIQLYAQGATVPGVTQNTADISYRGVTFHVPTNIEFSGEYTLTLRSDAAHRIRGAILAWKNSISALNIGGNPIAPGGNKRIGDNQIEIDLLDPGSMTPLTTYRLWGVIPTNAGEIEMSNEGAEPVTFDFSMTYQFFTTEISGEGVPSGVIPSDILSQGQDMIDKAQGVLDIAQMINNIL